MLSTIVLTMPCFGCPLEILSESLVRLNPHMVLKEKYGASTITRPGSIANTGGQSTLSQGVMYRKTERGNSRGDHFEDLWKKKKNEYEIESDTYQSSEISQVPI